MSYFWSTFIQPLCEEETPQPQPRPRPQFKQQVLPKQEERDVNASIPTAEAFAPKYVTRKPKRIVVPPTPPPPPTTPQEFVEDGECTPTRVCITHHRPESLLFESTTTDSYDDDCCTPTRETESKFVFDFTNLELNKYNIRAECTPQHSLYNSPRISVDKLDMFNWEPKYTTVNNGMFKNLMVNGGRVQPRSLPSSPVVKRQRVPSVSLGDVQYNLQSGIQELARLQKQFEKLSIQLLDLQTEMY